MIDELIKLAKDLVGTSLDAERYLIFGNAFQKRILFLYEVGASEPAYVVRIPLGDEGRQQCKREYRNLHVLSQLGLPNVDFPRPVGTFQLMGRPCFMQTALYARPLMNMLPMSRWSRLGQREFYWLTDCLISIYQAGLSKHSKLGKSYYPCFQHGDFWAGNLGRRDNTLAMYDLEFGNASGWPLYDLLHFGLYFRVVMSNVGKVHLKRVRGKGRAMADDRKTTADSKTVEQAFLDQSPLAQVMRRCIRRYATGCSIDEVDVLGLVWRFFSYDRKINGLAEPAMQTILAR